MNVLNNTINRLNFILDEAPQKIKAIPEAELSRKPAENKWSKKEIIGHLCDSAINNLSRFARAQFEEEPFKVIPYAQDDWVRVNHYNEMKIEDILNYWSAINKQIIHIISSIPEAKLGVICELGNAAFREGEIEKSLLWLIEDYVVHMEYHLRQVVGEI
ncbi:MAG: DinB family protein [Ignavibacteria bacterium]